MQSSLTEEVEERGGSFERHLQTMVRERDAIVAAGLPLPAHLAVQPTADLVDAALTSDDDDEQDDEQDDDAELEAEKTDAK